MDVRSSPYSKYAPQFNRKAIKEKLEENRVHYNFLGDSFGARQIDPNLCFEDGIVDFNKVKESDKFKTAFNKVIDNINGANIVLMCSEKEPIDCHRSILISNAFYEEGINIEHILDNGEIETQKDLENRLLSLYKLPRKSEVTLDFFSKNSGNSKLNNLKQAYEKRNRDVSYNITSK